MSCPGCGAPRADDVKFYLPDGAAEVTDAATVARAKSGADWNCSYCGAASPATMGQCSNCGAGKEDSKHRAVVDHVPGQEPPKPKPAPTGGAAKAAGIGVGGLAIMAALCCCLMMAAVFFGRPKDVAVEVSKVTWERSIPVEAQKPVTEEGWTLPAGAKQLGQQRKVKSHREVFSHMETRTRKKKVQVGTKKVKVGTRDLGNGYFEDIMKDEPIYEMRDEQYQERVMKKEPIYAPWYRYSVVKWVTVRTEKAQGSDANPVWPEVQLGQGERKGQAKEVYTLHLLDAESSKTYTKTLPEVQWKTFSVGEKVNATISAKGEVQAVGALKVEAD